MNSLMHLFVNSYNYYTSNHFAAKIIKEHPPNPDLN